MKVQKGEIIKEINEEGLLADYISAGWKKVEDKIEEKERKSKFDKIKGI